jgi:hypothetical protein
VSWVRPPPPEQNSIKQVSDESDEPVDSKWLNALRG